MNEQTKCEATTIASMTPTQMILEFRNRVLGGDCPMPFSEGTTVQQQEQHATKLRQRARADG